MYDRSLEFTLLIMLPASQSTLPTLDAEAVFDRLGHLLPPTRRGFGGLLAVAAALDELERRYQLAPGAREAALGVSYAGAARALALHVRRDLPWSDQALAERAVRAVGARIGQIDADCVRRDWLSRTIRAEVSWEARRLAGLLDISHHRDRAAGGAA